MATRFISIIIVLWPSISFCDNQSTLNKLQSEPASMYDLGMYRLQEYIDTVYVDRNLGITSTFVLPDFKDDYPGEIVIWLFYQTRSITESKINCKNIVKTFRERDSISSQNHTSSITSFFTHSHYIRKGYDMNKDGKRDAEFAKAITQLFTIVANEIDKKIMCFGPYNGDSITFR
ncbi:MAG: hypothetical protein AB2704_26000 [Candidatus Thiodiazotropha taylori]